MIYILEFQDYSDSYIQQVLEGPSEPGMEALLRNFDAALDIPELPVWSAYTGQPDWNEISARGPAWRQERDRIVSGRYGGTTTAPDWGAYWKAVVKWLRDEHGYKQHEFDVIDTNL